MTRFCLSPVSPRTMNRAPRFRIVDSAPLAASAVSCATLCGVTRSGNVRLFATVSGTPSSRIDTCGSPVITVRAVKSVRLPIRFCLTSPCLPSMRLRIALTDLPTDADRLNPVDGAGTSEPSRRQWTLYAMSCSVTCIATGAAPSVICRLSRPARFTMYPIVDVRSSWLTTDALSEIAGRTCGGGMGSAVNISRRGCVNWTSKPRHKAAASSIRSSVA